MWMLTSSVLLATLLVSGLSFPHPDKKEYKIPDVGTGRRAQYYVLHRDGTFKYGFDTGEGAYEKSKSQSVGSQQGAFGYTDPDGKEIKLEYEAGKGGFLARGDHLPQLNYDPADFAQLTRRSKPFVDPLANTGSDASYNFGFNSDSHSRNEQSDSDGRVTGSYNYIDENGVLREYNYEAGKGIGFQISGQGLSVPNQQTRRSGSSFRTASKTKTINIPIITTKESDQSQITATRRQSFPRQHEDAVIKSVTGDNGAYSFSYSAGTHSRSETGDENLNVDGNFEFTVPEDNDRRRLEYEAGSDTGFIVKADHLPIGPSVPGAEDGKPSGQFVRYRKRGPFVDPLANSGADSSYNFGFDSDTYSRSESADKDGNVVGSYTLVEEDGTKVTREFRAGKGTGFEITNVSKVPGTPIQTSFRSSQPVKPVTYSHQSVAKVEDKSAFRNNVKQRNEYNDANIQTSSGDDGSYSFSYKTDTHSRSESGNANNDVDGKFSFIAIDDGIERELQYEAGRDTGFIVEADYLPIGPPVPGAEDGKPSGQFARNQKSNFVDPLASGDADSSYNFGFESDTYSRSEIADEDGNIDGEFTVVEEDGTRVTTKFKAGKGIGYEIKEITRTPGAPPPKAAFRAQQHTSYKKPVQTANVATAQISSVKHQSSFEPSNLAVSTGENGEYSFSYKTDTHSRSESGDSDNKVLGKFAFIAEDDGLERKLEYEAGKETGFIVTADHLPIGPSVPGAEDGKPSGQFARYQKSEFIDPLASSRNRDSSYQFSFDSDSYSRSETSDKDGNIEGTFTIVDDDGTKVTNKFRAGTDTGYVVEEVSRLQGIPPVRSSTSQKISNKGESTKFKGTSFSGQRDSHVQTSHGTSRHTSFSRKQQSGSVDRKRGQTFSQVQRKPQKTYSGHKTTTMVKAGDKPGSTVIVSPEYSVYQYNPSPQSEKFGYVIQYN